MDYQAAVTTCHDIPGMIWMREIRALHSLFKGSKVHVEIGSYAGKSLFITAYAMGSEAQLISVDDFRCTVVEPTWTYEVFSATTRLIKRRFDVDVRLLKMNSVDAHRVILEEGIELDSVFIDADHSYSGCLSDIECWTPLVKSGGIIAGHDYCASYRGVMKAVNDTGEFQVCEGTRIWWRRR